MSWSNSQRFFWDFFFLLFFYFFRLMQQWNMTHQLQSPTISGLRSRARWLVHLCVCVLGGGSGGLGSCLLNRDITMHSGTDWRRPCNKQAAEAGGAGVEVRWREGAFVREAFADLHGLLDSARHVYHSPCLPASQILSGGVFAHCPRVRISTGKTFTYLQRDL